MADSRQCELQAMQCGSRQARSDKHSVECIQLKFVVSKSYLCTVRRSLMKPGLLDILHGLFEPNVAIEQPVLARTSHHTEAISVERQSSIGLISSSFFPDRCEIS